MNNAKFGLCNLSAKDNNGRLVLSDINLSIQPGVLYMILGDSGSGKTMLVNILAGLYPASGGEIYIDNEGYKPRNPKDAVRAGLSFLFQTPPAFYDSMVSENIFLGNFKTTVINWKHINLKARKWLNFVGLEIDPATNIKDLAQDDQTLVLLARALATQPAILIIDETMSDLNQVHTRKFIRSIMDFRSSGGIILYLSSRPDQMAHLADTIGILEDEHIKHQLTAKDIQSDPDLLMNLYTRKRRISYWHLSDLNDKVIKAFFKSSELLASEYELQDVLEFLAERACQLTEAYACSIRLIDGESGDIVNTTNYGDYEIPGLKPDLEKEVWRKGKSLWLMGKELGDSFMEPYNSKISGLVCVPIKIRDQITGMIEFFFSDFPVIIPDMDVIKVFANQTALAIENTRLLGRSVLLQEAHHRIKNNLQSIISLLSLQMEKEQSEEVAKAISQSVSRIKAIASVHEILSRDQRASSYTDVQEIVQKLVDWSMGKINERDITIEFFGRVLFLPYKKATSLALVVNELLTNCLEHAFPDNRKGHILVKMKQNGKKMQLEVNDDGIGFQSYRGKTNIEEEHLGLWLVRLLVTKDLAGNFSITSNNGVNVTIVFPMN